MAAPAILSMVAVPRLKPVRERTFPVTDYNLEATLTSGQAFRWRFTGGGWESVIGLRWVRLVPGQNGIHAITAGNQTEWSWLVDYLQLETNLKNVLASFPADEALRTAVCACRGLRLLRQDVWECLASFILSSTKQITQIQTVVDRLCRRFGDPVGAPEDSGEQFSFPDAKRIAGLTERELRACGMGFRAPYLLASARKIAGEEIALDELKAMNVEAARNELMRLPGVGRKIADCVLLFAVGHGSAFPVDVWILRTLRELYFAGQDVPMKTLVEYVEGYFGPNAGYAQQYLFHFARSRAGRIRR